MTDVRDRFIVIWVCVRAFFVDWRNDEFKPIVEVDEITSDQMPQQQPNRTESSP